MCLFQPFAYIWAHSCVEISHPMAQWLLLWLIDNTGSHFFLLNVEKALYYLFTASNLSLPVHLSGCECKPAGGCGPSLRDGVFRGRSRRSEDARRPSSQHTQQHGRATGRHHLGLSRSGRFGAAWVPPEEWLSVMDCIKKHLLSFTRVLVSFWIVVAVTVLSLRGNTTFPSRFVLG